MCIVNIEYTESGHSRQSKKNILRFYIDSRQTFIMCAHMHIYVGAVVMPGGRQDPGINVAPKFSSRKTNKHLISRQPYLFIIPPAPEEENCRQAKHPIKLAVGAITLFMRVCTLG